MYFANFTDDGNEVHRFEIWIQYAVFYILLNLPALIGNIILLSLIVMDKNLHTFFFALIAGHVANRILYSIQFATTAVMRIYGLVVFDTDLFRTTRLRCHTANVLHYFCDPFDKVSLCLLAIDRMIALGDPLRYHRFSFRTGLRLITGLAMFTVVVFIPSYVGVINGQSSSPCSDDDVTCSITCRNALSPMSLVWLRYILYFHVSLSLLGVILYLSLRLIISTRIKRMDDTGWPDHRVKQLTKRHMQILPFINALIVINMFGVFIAELLLLISNYFSPPTSTRLVIYGAELIIADILADVFVFFWKCTELRNSFKRVYCS